ncbi:hypothetical protein MPER_03636, partial [Moniliophthora perniciosa FA553]
MFTAASPLFTPTKLGNLDLQHRIVVSPPSHEPIAPDTEDFYRKCATEGRTKIIHEAKGVAFCLVDARDSPVESMITGLIDQVSEAISCGYDGIELDASQGSVLQSALLNCQSQEQVVNKLFEILKAAVTVIPEERLGIRFSPFAVVDGDRAANKG